MVRATIRDAAIIVALSSVLGVVYNAAFSVKPLPWIRQPRIIDTASTEALVKALAPAPSAPASMAAPVQQQRAADTARPLHARSARDSQPKPAAPKLPPLNDAVPPQQQSRKVQAVTYQQVLMLLRNEDVLFFDARRQEEYQQGHIPRAQNVDIQLFEMDPAYRNSVMPMLYSIDKRRPIVVYCGGGECELSHKLADVLTSLGFEHVFIYTGGWNEYSSKPDAPR